MQSLEKLADAYRSAGTTAEGIDYIASVRESQPARRVGGTRFLAVTSRFPSKKMGRTIQAESRTGELPFAQSLELDDDVVEYYDQPATVQVTRFRGGRKHLSPYTADFLVLRRARAQVVQIKPQKWINEQRELHPAEWTYEKGRWESLPLSAPFRRMGIEHVMRPIDEIGGIEAANLNILATLRSSVEEPPQALLDKATKVLKSSRPMTILQLQEELGLTDASRILYWIAAGYVFFARKTQLVTSVHTARVFLSFDGACAFAKNVELSSAADVDQSKGCASNESPAVPMFRALSDKEILEAMARYEAVLPAYKRERPATRNERRIIQRIDAAIKQGGGPLDGCATRIHNRGNRSPRLSDKQLKTVEAAISTLLMTPARRSVKWAYNAIEWGGEARVSYESFLRHVKRVPRHEYVRARSGHRAWLAHRPPSHPDTRVVWPTAAWELVHIDHTPIDEKVWGDLGVAQVLGRPWLTTMIDAWSGAAIAFWLSFSAPSWQSLAMLLRDCVRRHGRLPVSWISDHGSEFGGRFWETFSAQYGCSKLDRPVSDARSGSPVERSFGMLHRQLINQLDGNMQNDKRGRESTASHRSESNARYAIARIYEEIDRYLFSFYNERPHGPSAFSPIEMQQQSETELGPISPRVKYDLRFMIDTASQLHNRRYTVDARRGIRVFQRTYWNEALADPTVQGVRAEVRAEPFDSSVVYAHLRGEWIRCVGSRHVELSAMDDFSRWAQSAIDHHGRPFTQAIRREADERFAKRQAEVWATSDLQRRGAEPPINGEEPPKKFEKEVSLQSDSVERDQFGLLRALPMDPLEDM